jgi:hypothetical protein
VDVIWRKNMKREGENEKEKRGDCGVKELESKRVRFKQQGRKTVLNGERRKQYSF